MLLLSLEYEQRRWSNRDARGHRHASSRAPSPRGLRALSGRRAGDADTAAWSLEGRYQLRGDLFWALRFGQQLFDTVGDGADGERAFDRDAKRIETAVAWRRDRHAQLKLQYGYTMQRGDLEQEEQMAAFQASPRF